MLLVANWKAYVDDLRRARALFAQSKRLTRVYKTKIVLAPSAPILGALASKNASRVAFATQDVSSITGGAHTGEITALAAKATGATYAIIGHSERRAAGDTSAIVAEKLSHALAHELTPILCVGETERDPEGHYLHTLRTELRSALEGLTAKERARLIIAYEPVWAINKSAAEAMSETDLAEMVLYLRKVLSEFIPGKGAFSLPILYGGSVEATNIRGLAGGSGVDGFLVGHASAELHSFTNLVRALG